MDKDTMQKILILLSALILFACGGGSGGSSSGGATPNPPELMSLDPTDNASSVPVDSSISATFDKNMDEGEESTFVVYGSQTGKLSGTYTGGGSGTLSFDADFEFKPGEEIEVILTDMLTSTDGQFLESPFVYCFRAKTSGGTGIFAVVDTVSGQTGIRALVAGDWDGDGVLDLAAANFDNNEVAILRNDGSGDFTFTAGDAVSPLTDPKVLAAGDWDDDGDLDLAANDGTNTVVVLKNDGNGNFTVVDTILGQTGIQALVAGDWDGDRVLDLAAANSNSNEVAILRNDGSGDFTFTAGDTVSGQTNVQALVAGDWDGDGVLDLAAANFDNNEVAILRNDGSGDFTFTAGDTVSPLTDPKVLAAGDWDGDGDLDLVANDGTNTVKVLGNDELSP